MSLKYEPSLELLLITAKPLSSNRELLNPKQVTLGDAISVSYTDADTGETAVKSATVHSRGQLTITSGIIGTWTHPWRPLLFYYSWLRVSSDVARNHKARPRIWSLRSHFQGESCYNLIKGVPFSLSSERDECFKRLRAVRRACLGTLGVLKSGGLTKSGPPGLRTSRVD